MFIKTFGCQMNVYDTEVACGLLGEAGFEVVCEDDFQKEEKPTRGKNFWNPKADVVLMNTCSVREHAEERVFGRLGLLGKAKKENPNLIVGLMGCMVEEHKEKLFKRFPQLDLMIGTRNIKELPALIDEAAKTRRQVSRIKQDGISIEYTEQIKRGSKYHAWLPIMTGCNKVCTFCIVPITRGSEVSMPAREVYREASRLVSEGVKWITLLGQNVNSYRGNDVGANLCVRPVEHICGKDHGQTHRSAPTVTTFPELLEMLCQIDGLERISFTTSHPQDATEELFQVIARNPKISRHFHLPLQSGSNRILKRMKRLHTYEEYKVKIDRMREIIPDVVVTTDIIAGFSGETGDDHQATVRALREIRYDSAYIYKYSLRAQTPASKLPDDVPITIKESRNHELIEIQNQISDEKKKQYLGAILDVFAEDVGTKNNACLVGRSNQEKKVVFPGEKTLLGTFVKVKIESLKNETLFGTFYAA